MKNLDNAIGLIKDPATQEALKIIASELKRIRTVQPVTEDTKSLALAINRIIGKL